MTRTISTRSLWPKLEGRCRSVTPDLIRNLVWLVLIVFFAILAGAIGQEVARIYLDRPPEMAEGSAEKFREMFDEATTNTAEKLREIIDEATTNNPTMTAAEALQEEGSRRAERLANDPNLQVPELMAASNFFGFLLVQTRTFPQHCEALSTNMDNYVARFSELHATEIEKATAIVERYGLDQEAFQQIWANNSEPAAEIVKLDLEGQAEASGVSPREVCEFLDEMSADEEFMSLRHFSTRSPDFFKILMEP